MNIVSNRRVFAFCIKFLFLDPPKSGEFQSHRFEPDVNWHSYEEDCAYGWQQNAIIFTQPFYMLEYALAHMGALQLYQKACLDHQATWQVYREALTLGGTLRLADLFQAAGADFPLRPEVVKGVADFLAARLRG